MRAKNREINIFNMSLLDVLTGALGAFMFMMLSFVPYYNIVMEQHLEENPNEEKIQKDKLAELMKQKDKIKELEEKIKKLEEEKKELQDKIDELIEKMKKMGKGDVTAEELAKLEEENARLRKRIQELEDEVDDLNAKIDKLIEQNLDLKALVEKLKAEIEELKRQLALMKPSDPRIEAMLRVAQAELAAQEKSIVVVAELDDQTPFEFIVRDPKGMYYDQRSSFPFGRKAARVQSATGQNVSDSMYNARPPGEINLLMLRMDGMAMFGDYLVGVRLAGGTRNYKPVPVAAATNSPNSASPPSARIENPFIFGLAPEKLHEILMSQQYVFFPRRTSFPNSPPSAELGPELASPLNSIAQADPLTRGFPSGSSADELDLGTSFGALFEAESDAYAQSSEGAARQLAESAADKAIPKVRIHGYAIIRFRGRTNIEPIPDQMVPADGTVSVLALLTVNDPRKNFYSLDFHWYAPRGRAFPQSVAARFFSAEARSNLETKMNNPDSVLPLVSSESCRFDPVPCAEDPRGNLEDADIDPAFSRIREDRAIAESQAPPTVAPAKTAGAGATTAPLASTGPSKNPIDGRREAEASRNAGANGTPFPAVDPRVLRERQAQVQNALSHRAQESEKKGD